MAGRRICELFGAVCGICRCRFWVAFALVVVLTVPMASFAAPDSTAAMAAAGCHQGFAIHKSSGGVVDCAATSCEMSQMPCGTAGCALIVSSENRSDGWQGMISSVKRTSGDHGLLICTEK